MIIEPLADHQEFVEIIGKWHWIEWGHADPNGSLDSWTKGIAQRIRRDGIPTTFVAISPSGELLGSVTLVENDMDTHPELSPWLAGLYVPVTNRGMRIGSTLVEHAMKFAAQIGCDSLYLHTSTAVSLYQKLGWIEIEHEPYEGEDVTIMMCRVA